MTEAERFLEERMSQQRQAPMLPQAPPAPPAEKATPAHDEAAAQGGIGSRRINIMNRVSASIAFLVLIFLGTYIVRLSHGDAGSAFIGYALGAAAFIFAPMIWKSK
jgi:multisubunit Na+/H+ antiporter MnhB subunit